MMQGFGLTYIFYGKERNAANGGAVVAGMSCLSKSHGGALPAKSLVYLDEKTSGYFAGKSSPT